VNLLVDNAARSGAPVIHEPNPTYANLLGRVEYVAQLGALATNFTLIRPGALQRANGGYLVLDARKVLTEPFAWEGLKRALRSGELRIESVARALTLVDTVSLEPEPIPLSVKVALVGERRLHDLLTALDPEYPELFKVVADFDDRITRDPATERLFARVVATTATRAGTRPVDAAGVARLLEHLARSAGDQERLSTHMRTLADLVLEADDRAVQAGRPTVGAAEVEAALEGRRRRVSRRRELLLEAIRDGTLRIETTGEAVGQVNGLSVHRLGDEVFGWPTRISARVRLGAGELVDIEREVELGGPIHSKGVLILAGYLGGRYSPDRPFSLHASLVFEQSYGGVEGDSASLAELIALLSAIGDVPVRRSIAMTGSIDQWGHVQAIGGVNEKVEGFFEVCRARDQLAAGVGVIIPTANVRHLMLRSEVVEAVAAGRFRIWAVDSVDAAVELATGQPSGEVDAAVERRLERLAATARDAVAGPGPARRRTAGRG
jgi:predicted ATP-dependent protease